MGREARRAQVGMAGGVEIRALVLPLRRGKSAAWVAEAETEGGVEVAVAAEVEAVARAAVALAAGRAAVV